MGRKWTQAEKDAQSKRRTKYLKEHPDLKKHLSRVAKRNWKGMTPEEYSERVKSNKAAHNDLEYLAQASILRTEEWTNEKIRNRRIKSIRKIVQTVEYRQGVSDLQKRLWKKNKQARLKVFRRSMKKHYKSQETHAATVAKILSHRKMSRAELQLNSLLKLLDLPYKYVGSGQLMIGRFCPDFKRQDKPALLEMNGFHHKKSLTIAKLRKRDVARREFIKSKGYVTLEIDEDELIDLNKLAKKILRFEKRIRKLKAQ